MKFVISGSGYEKCMQNCAGGEESCLLDKDNSNSCHQLSEDCRRECSWAYGTYVD